PYTTLFRSPRDGSYLWSSQSRGVGHYAKAAERYAYSNDDVVQTLLRASASSTAAGGRPARSVELLMGEKRPRRVYDAPDKGILWGWEVPAYVSSKAVSTGVFMLLVRAGATGGWVLEPGMVYAGLGLSILFLLLTGIFLVKDLDRPDRFLNVLLRPQ